MEDPEVHGIRASETPFFDLPQELIWKMLYYLPPKDAVHFCLTHRGAAQIICHNNNFWFEKIWRDFGDAFELNMEDIPVENRIETYKKYWKETRERLFECAIDGKVECVASLLHIGVSPNVWLETGGIEEETALLVVLMDHVGGENENIVRLLLEYDANPNIREDHEGWTALMLASGKGQDDLVMLLLEHDADPDFQDEDDMTALLHATTANRTNIVRVLLEHDADPDYQNFDNETALMVASEEGYTNIARLLLEHDADPDIEGAGTLTALQIASGFGNIDIVGLLRTASQT